MTVTTRNLRASPLRTTTTVVVGAGQAGLAMSRRLTEASIDHVVLERGEVGDSWRHGRWDSLRLLTPNWQSRLPGATHQWDDPDGYMSVPEVTAMLEGYAKLVDAPVQTNTSVTGICPTTEGFLIETSQGEWRARAVVLANGAATRPVVPAVASALPAQVASITPDRYRRPAQLRPGGVLVVGASATGVQLAEEIHRSGRPVTLAVGDHVRVPRRYRGRDLMWWLDASGLLDEQWWAVEDLDRARRLPSFQLVGDPRGVTLDLNRLVGLGVRLVGRLVGIVDGVAQFSGSLRNHCTLADLKLQRLVASFDEWATAQGLDGSVDAPERFAPTAIAGAPPLTLDLTGGEIETVVWATGYRGDLSWLDVPIFDSKGRVRHEGGVTPIPGLYVMGLPFLRRRKSTLIDGVGDDAADLVVHLCAHLDRLAVTAGGR